ncbi:SDR family NAD(P)-dependent oxidoreductase [Pseudomonas stutzeri]|nr:SDR family NAD(P)-dependent oxidoreductase [Stutzerimonas stutzeri]
MGKHAVVTGAASGIGADCCRDLYERGVTVFGLDRDEQKLKQVAESAGGQPGRFIPIPCDASDTDALVCSAGVSRPGALMELSESD